MSIKTRWKSSFSTLIAIAAVFIILGGFIGLFYFIYAKTSISDETIMIIAGLVGIPLLLGAIWYFRIIRERKSRQNFIFIQKLSEKTGVNEDQIINETVVPSLEKIGATNIQVSYEYPPRIVFSFPQDNALEFLANVSLVLKGAEMITIDALLQYEYPFSLSIRKIDIKNLKEAKFRDLYYIFSTRESLTEAVSNSKNIQSILMKQALKIRSVTFKGKFVSGVLTSPYEIYQLLELIRLIYHEISIDDYGDIDVEELVCYTCGDKFEVNEKKCNKCNAPRPTCCVCLLDLKPSEKDEVVSTPCCEVYAHKDHILVWLENNPKCPNCRKDLYLWIRTLRQE
jgi:hypothetical protein